MSFQEYFHGLTVLVTGSGKGIGRALAIRLHSYGAKVIALSRTASTLTSLEEECPGIKTICMDLGAEDWNTVKEKIGSLGEINALINCAGIVVAKPFMEVTQEQYNSQMNINVGGIFSVSQAVVKGMIERGKGGSIVNISSLYSQRGVPNYSVYCTSKAGVDMLTKTMANELAKYKIRVNSVNPGAVLTPMVYTEVKELGISFEEYTKEYLAKVPLGIPYIPMDDIVNTVLFTLSGLTSCITGSNILIDAGYATW